MGKGFDYIVHKRNSKGKVISSDPYKMVVTKEGALLERPPGSGLWYYPDGELARDDNAQKEAPKDVPKKEAAQPVKEVVAEPKVDVDKAVNKLKEKFDVEKDVQKRG